jgi:hypothetical protein
MVTLTITDMLSRVVAEPVHQRQSSGTYTKQWNAASFPSGMYFYTLQANGFRETKRMMLLK